MSVPNRRGDGVLHEVAVRATVDLEFRRCLLADPAKAIYDAFGVTIPAGHALRFIEKPAGVDTLIVLPDFHPPGEELDDDDLDAVAGGTTCYESTTAW